MKILSPPATIFHDEPLFIGEKRSKSEEEEAPRRHRYPTRSY